MMVNSYVQKQDIVNSALKYETILSVLVSDREITIAEKNLSL